MTPQRDALRDKLAGLLGWQYTSGVVPNSIDAFDKAMACIAKGEESDKWPLDDGKHNEWANAKMDLDLATQSLLAAWQGVKEKA